MIMMEAMSVRFGIGLRTFGKAGQGRQGQGGSSFLKKGTKKTFAVLVNAVGATNTHRRE
jgi:hypothetical protein